MREYIAVAVNAQLRWEFEVAGGSAKLRLFSFYYPKRRTRMIVNTRIQHMPLRRATIECYAFVVSKGGGCTNR